MSENNKPSLAIIGCGNMGSAMARQLSHKANLFLYDHNIDKTQALEKEGHGKSTKQIEEAIKNAEIVILAVKPQNFREISPILDKSLKSQQVLVSIMTGITLTSLRHQIKKPQIVRMMPNIALQVSQGVIALTSYESIKTTLKKKLELLFSSLGKIFWIPENKIDALTSLTGSGPAFIFVIIETMIEAGIAMGFSAAEATELVIQTIKGSTALIEERKHHPGVLKWMVTSPAGTTIAGLKEMEANALRYALMSTFLATYDRAIELSSLS